MNRLNWNHKKWNIRKCSAKLIEHVDCALILKHSWLIFTMNSNWILQISSASTLARYVNALNIHHCVFNYLDDLIGYRWVKQICSQNIFAQNVGTKSMNFTGFIVQCSMPKKIIWNRKSNVKTLSVIHSLVWNQMQTLLHNKNHPIHQIMCLSKKKN